MPKPEKLVVTAGLALTAASFAYFGAEKVYDERGYLNTAEGLERCVGDVAILGGTVEGCDLDSLGRELEGANGATIAWEVDGDYIIGMQPITFKQEDIQARIQTLKDKDAQYGPHVGKAAAAAAGLITIIMSLWGRSIYDSLWNCKDMSETTAQPFDEQEQEEPTDAIVIKIKPSQNTEGPISTVPTPATVTKLTGTIT